MESIHPLKIFRERQTPPLTQEQLADVLGVSKAAVSRWEAGARRIDDELLPKVSEVTGIPRTELRPDLVRLLDDSRGPE